MRRTFARAIVLGLAVAACVRAPQPVESPASPPDAPVAADDDAGEPLDPSPYVVADAAPGRGAQVVVPMGKGEGDGVLLDGLRVLVGPGGVRAAREVADPPLAGAERLPPWLGGGFVVWSKRAIYTCPTFDGPLRPLVATPADVAGVAFGPSSLLVRAEDGERWAIDPRSGAPSALSPVGLRRVAALGDGRAAALTEFGGVVTTSDRGARWTDASPQLNAAVASVFTADDALWIATDGGDALRVEPGGALARFDAGPTVKAPELRARDPRWTASEAPIRRALRLGAPVDEGLAVVVSDGALFKVSLRDGAIVAASPGRLPPDATCEAVRAQDDLVFACTRSGGPSFVASRVTGGAPPIVEQTFAFEGRFSASDDGAIAFGGPCSRGSAAPPPSPTTVCVRAAAGGWQEHALDGRADAGASPPEVVRWIPRADGGAFGLIAAPKPAIVDARTGDVRPWLLDGVPANRRTSLDVRARWQKRELARVVDRAWSSSPGGGVRGWIDGLALDVARDGAVTASPFTFDRTMFAGPLGLGATKDGRLWQTSDRGAAWVEVERPLSARDDKMIEPRLCGAPGCDLGLWYRVGWPERGRLAAEPPKIAAPAPRLASPAPPRLACRPAGDARSVALQRTDASPEDLGLGATRVPRGADDAERMRAFHARVPPNLAHGVDVAPDRDEASPRALFHGYATSSGDDERFVVMGPHKDPRSLRREVAFVAPFDTAAAVRRTSFGVSELIAAGRSIGMGTPDVLREDPTVPSALAVAVSQDPSAPSDLVFVGDAGLVGVLRAGRDGAARARVTLRVRPTEPVAAISAASLGGDDLALLTLESRGYERVVAWTAQGLVDRFDVAAPASSEDYPANPDALAVGPHGELAVIRTGSGGTPATAGDPALLFAPGVPPSPLAPWSTLVADADPACRAEPGWRAVIATVRPWVSVGGAGFKQIEEAPSFARVRWTSSRVCLEAIEVRVDDKLVTAQQREGSRGDRDPRDAGDRARVTPLEITTETWLVARFSAAPSAARVGVGPGVEVRQALDCALSR